MIRESNPYIDSRFEKMKIPCPMCGEIMGKRKGNEVWILKRQRGKVEEIKIDISHYDGNGHFRMECPCGGGHVFVTIEEKLNLTEHMATVVE